MTTTIQLEDTLLAEAEAFAAETGKSLAEIVEDALRQAIASRRPNGQKSTVKLKTHGSGGLQPGVDLNNTAALLDLMDAPHATS
jgi:hypothetical protein